MSLSLRILSPVGFWSYTREDDLRSAGRLSRLRLLLSNELHLQFGRRANVRLFQDVTAIPYGADWTDQIEAALRTCCFFIPVLTPDFLQSEWCSQEVAQFQRRQESLGRNDLMFPLHYVDVSHLTPEECYDPSMLPSLRRVQWIDFRNLRLSDPDGVEVSRSLKEISETIRTALRRPISPPTARPQPVERPSVGETANAEPPTADPHSADDPSSVREKQRTGAEARLQPARVNSARLVPPPEATLLPEPTSDHMHYRNRTPFEAGGWAFSAGYGLAALVSRRNAIIAITSIGLAVGGIYIANSWHRKAAGSDPATMMSKPSDQAEISQATVEEPVVRHAMTFLPADSPQPPRPLQGQMSIPPVAIHIPIRGDVVAYRSADVRSPTHGTFTETGNRPEGLLLLSRENGMDGWDWLRVRGNNNANESIEAYIRTDVIDAPSMLPQTRTNRLCAEVIPHDDGIFLRHYVGPQVYDLVPGYDPNDPVPEKAVPAQQVAGRLQPHRSVIGISRSIRSPFGLEYHAVTLTDGTERYIMGDGIVPFAGECPNWRLMPVWDERDHTTEFSAVKPSLAPEPAGSAVPNPTR